MRSIDAIVETLGTLLTTAPLSIYTEQAGSMGAAMAFGAVWLLFLYKAVGNYYRHPGEEHDSSRWDTKVDIRGIGVEKTAFFMITSDTTSTFDFLGAMIFSLMFIKMFEQAYNTAVTESHG